MNYLVLTLAGLLILTILTVFFAMILLRRVVPTNMVHIVQSSKSTVSYGIGRTAGNTYYEIPAWLPKFGVTVLKFPESIFQVSLADYEAYDQARLPFIVDVTAFFRVDRSEAAAQRVASFSELTDQLDSVLKGAVRRILATNTLEKIMEARSELGKQFTDEVDEQIKEWGVKTVKTIEFMDLRDSKVANSKVIHNIMAKEQSRIDKESRVAVASNAQAAQLSEIDAQRIVDVQRQDAEQQVGLRIAEKEKQIGIANELAQQDVQEQAAVTAERLMTVKRVEKERSAEIEKQVKVTEAEATSDAIRLESEGDLARTINEAKGIEADGQAKAKAQESLLLAPVTAQITLAKEIGGNLGYQQYLLSLEQIGAGRAVGIEMAGAIKEADLRIISNGTVGDGGHIAGGVAGLLDMFSAKGGTSVTGMLAALSQTPEGSAIVSRLTGKSDPAGAPSQPKE
jgi:flotillin